MKRILLIILCCIALLGQIKPKAYTAEEVLARVTNREGVFKDRRIKITNVGVDAVGDLIVEAYVYRNGKAIFTPDHQFIFHHLPKVEDPKTAVMEMVGSASELAAVGAFFATLTVYPDAGKPGTTSVDGDMGTNGNASYSTAHSTADCTDCSGNTIVTTENSGSAIGSINTPGCGTITTTYSVIRSQLNFDTSSLGAGATISSATISLMPSLAPTDYTGAAYVRIVTNSITSNTDYSTSDFNSIGSTAQATDINLSSMSAESYATWTLNATGLSNISKTGITKFGARIKGDLDNTSPAPGTPAFPDCLSYLSDGAIVYFYSRDNASGTSKSPKLVITYTGTANMKKRIIIG